MSLQTTCPICRFSMSPSQRVVEINGLSSHLICYRINRIKKDIYLIIRFASLVCLFSSIKGKRAFIGQITLGFVGAAIGNRISQSLPEILSCTDKDAITLIYLQFLAEGIKAIEISSKEEMGFTLLRTFIGILNHSINRNWGSYIGTLLGLRYGSKI